MLCFDWLILSRGNEWTVKCSSCNCAICKSISEQVIKESTSMALFLKKILETCTRQCAEMANIMLRPWQHQFQPALALTGFNQTSSSSSEIDLFSSSLWFAAPKSKVRCSTHSYVNSKSQVSLMSPIILGHTKSTTHACLLS